jgi:hypothetical protein
VNLADLTAKIQSNGKPLAVAGAVGVAGLALLKRKQAGGDVSKGTAAPAAGGSLATPNGQVVYSSEASDVYNAIQPQLETIGFGLNKLLNDKSAPDADSTIPVPADPLFMNYTVKAGDDVNKIAGWFGLNGGGDYLYNYGNNRAVIGSDPGMIHPGQVLQVATPRGAWVAANPGAS